MGRYIGAVGYTYTVGIRILKHGRTSYGFRYRSHPAGSGGSAQQGLADPPIDDLMEHADSKYALAIFAAKRARQINSYFTQLNEGLLQNVGPLVEYQNQEKPLSIAFREINSGLLEETLGEDDLSEGN